jgi:predicted HTH transcriptional regulator
MGLTSNSDELDDELVEKVLEFAKEGVTKKDIMERFSLSRPRVRRLTAELVNKDLLREHVSINLFLTTARGNIYLTKMRSKRKPSKLL